MSDQPSANLKTVMDTLTKAYAKNEPFAVVAIDVEANMNQIYLSDPADAAELAYILYMQAVKIAGIDNATELPSLFAEGMDDASSNGPN